MTKKFFKVAVWIMLVLSIQFLSVRCTENEEVKLKKPESKNETSEVNSAARTAGFDGNLALRWAPVHLQDTDVTGAHGLSGKADYLSAINFDGDWVATNNWNNLANYQTPSVVYYSVVETSTHWFVIYAFFHPRDWTDLAVVIDEHENDLEGYLSVVKKDGSLYGSQQAIITVAHSDFYSFVPQGSVLQANQESIDGILSFETYNGAPHPLTAQQAKGHGLKAYPYYNISGGDGLKYYPSSADIAELPANANDRFVAYNLVDIFKPSGLWDQRFNTNLFVSAAGAFKKSYGSGGASAPWAWDDGNDGGYAGELAYDPVQIVNMYFKNLGEFSPVYLKNKYKGI